MLPLFPKTYLNQSFLVMKKGPLQALIKLKKDVLNSPKAERSF
jgi:hypothetical protein